MPSTAGRFSVKSYGLTTRYGFLWQKWYLKWCAGDECVILLVWCWLWVFFFLLFAFHIFRQVMVHAWRQTLTDTELSKSHEFDVVRNLRAFDAGCLQRQGSWYGCCLTVFVSMGTSCLELTSLKVTFLLA